MSLIQHFIRTVKEIGPVKVAATWTSLLLIFAYFNGGGIDLLKQPAFIAMMVTSLAALAATLGFLTSTQSSHESETLAAAERDVASSADTLTRNFQERINQEIDSAVSRLAKDSDRILRERLAHRIEESIGENLVQTLGNKLENELATVHKLTRTRQISSDSFELMRTRALQYAAAAARQSAFFRVAAIFLALIGLISLGSIVYAQRVAIVTHPDMLQRHIDWPMLILSNGPTYAFVVLCEFLALIMFRYQSKALEYMRYFSNEATNIDARRIGFLTALDLLPSTDLEFLVKRLEATERNFLISKDQRTLEIANNESEDRAIDRVQKILLLARAETTEASSRSDGTNRITG